MGGYSNVNRQETQNDEVPKKPTDASSSPGSPLASLPETLVLTTSVLPRRDFLLGPAVPEPIGRFPVLLYAQALCPA